jgi:hypothetical protein
MKLRSKRDTQTTRSRLGRREFALYDGVTLIGVIKVAVDGAYVAYNSRGKRVGVFPSLQAASASLPKPVATRGGAT